MLEDAVLDTPEVETPEIDTPEVDAEVSDIPEPEPEVPEEGEETEEETEGEAEPVTTDGRTMPDSLKKAIAGIKATNPEAAKLIKGMFFADKEYRAVFPKPADALAAKGLIDQIGGTEGIQQIQAEREEWNQLDKSYAEGSPEFVKSIAEANPEAFVKTAAHVINEFASRSPEQYSYYANTVALNTLKNSGLDLGALAQAHARYADNPQAQAIIAEVHNALLGLKQKTTEFEQKRTDPREEQLKQRETEFEQKRRADFEGGVANQAETYLKDKMQPEIDRIVGTRKVDPEAMKGYQEMVKARVEKMLGEIPGFANNLEAHYRTGDPSKSVSYIQSQYNHILPIAAKVIEPYLRNITAAAPKPPTGKPAQRTASPGEVVLKEMPDWSEVDRSKTTVADLMMGNAVLKNGKKATGWI